MERKIKIQVEEIITIKRKYVPVEIDLNDYSYFPEWIKTNIDFIKWLDNDVDYINQGCFLDVCKSDCYTDNDTEIKLSMIPVENSSGYSKPIDTDFLEHLEKMFKEYPNYFRECIDCILRDIAISKSGY